MEIIDDLIRINEISDENFGKIIKLLSAPSVDDFDWALAIQNAVDNHDGNSAEKLVRFLHFIANKIISSGHASKTISELDEKFKKLTKGNENALAGWERITSQFDSLEGFFLNIKKEKIRERFSRMTIFDITTDIRPIFGIERDSIIENEVVHILKIGTSDEKSLLCEIRSDAIDIIISELNIAKEKEKLMRSKYGC